MNWLAFALCGPIFWAISTHLDKYLVERYFKDADVVVLLLFTAMMGVVLMPIIAFFEPKVFDRDRLSIVLMMVSGILYMGAITFYLNALQGHEASVVAPFFQSSPLFGYTLAYLILGETLSGTQMAGGLLIIGGVLFVSVGSGKRREGFRWQLAALMLCCGFVMSLSTLIFKAFAVKDEFWATTFWMFAGEALFGAAFLCIPHYRKQFFRLFRSNPIPAFVSRLFRHSGIYIRTDLGIKSPADLKGKVIGLPEYQMTANVWIRGMFQDEYSVKPSDIKWRRGGLEEGGREERAKINLPADVELKQVPDDRTLSQMLAAGEIDGLLSARAPSCFLQGAPNVGRLFPNYPEAEEAYYRKTKLFPIMHAIGIRKSLVEANPWLPVSIYKAYLKAKALCMHEMGQIGHLATTLPWPVYEYERVQKFMGEDFWPYGTHANRHALDTLARYSFEQGLSVRRLSVDEMFAKSTYELSKI